MMEKYRNKKGFTLVELIVVIAIVAALSISMGVSSIQTLKETRIKDARETYTTIFNAAKLYAKLKAPVTVCSKDSDITCNKCASNASESSPCKVNLCCLSSNGLLDEDIFNTIDPVINTDDSYYTRGSIEDDSVNFYLKQDVLVFYNGGVMYTAMENRFCSDFIINSDTIPTFTGTTRTYHSLGNYTSWNGECNF